MYNEAHIQYVDRDEDDEKAKSAEMKRYRKDSFFWYKKVIETNGENLEMEGK